VLACDSSVRLRAIPLQCDGEIYSFYLDVGRIIGNFHFSIVLVGTLGVNISS